MICQYEHCPQETEVEPDRTQKSVMHYKNGSVSTVSYPMKQTRYCYYHRKLLQDHFNFKKKHPNVEVWEVP